MKTITSKLEPIGLIFFILGSFFHFMHWPLGTLLLTLAVFTISAGMLLDSTKTNDIYYNVSKNALIVFIISSMFWIVNLPGASAIKVAGIASLVIFFAFRLINSFKIEIYWNKILSISVNTTFVFLCLSFIFTYQSWPFRSFLMVFTFLGFALCSTLFYILTMDKIKSDKIFMKVTPRNVTVLSIGLLIVFFNLLHKVPFSTQLTSFNECKMIQKEKSVLIKRGDDLTKSITDSFSIDFVNKMNDLTDTQLEELQQIKIKMLNESSNDIIYQAYKSGNKVIDLSINYDNMNHPFSYDVPMYVLQLKKSTKGKSMGEQLHEDLVNYKVNLVNTLKTVESKVMKRQLDILDSNTINYQNLELESIQSNFYFLNIEITNEYQSKNWVEYNFDHLILINTLEKFSEIERCILKSRVEALLFLAKKK